MNSLRPDGCGGVAVGIRLLLFGKRKGQCITVAVDNMCLLSHVRLFDLLESLDYIR
jgi:hypothetical protein